MMKYLLIISNIIFVSLNIYFFLLGPMSEIFIKPFGSLFIQLLAILLYMCYSPVVK